MKSVVVKFGSSCPYVVCVEEGKECNEECNPLKLVFNVFDVIVVEESFEASDDFLVVVEGKALVDNKEVENNVAFIRKGHTLRVKKGKAYVLIPSPQQ